MTTPDPEDVSASGARRFSEPGDVDAAFAAIVAQWREEADAPRWPADPTDDDGPSSGVGLATPPQGQPSAHPERRPDGDPGDLGDPAGPGAVTPGPYTPGAPPPRTDGPTPVPHRPATSSGDPDGEHGDHFVPPDPPPLPALGMSSLVGLLLLVLGVVLLALPALVGGGSLGIVPGLLAMTAGLGWLVVGMRRSTDPDDAPDERGEL